jgi:S1-C subfamily serine protease
MAVATRIADYADGRGNVYSYAGTTAAQNIQIGYKPAFMIFYNQTDGDDVNIWCKNSLTTFVNIAAAAGNISAAITQVDDGTTIGFALPSDSDCNEDGKTYVVIAWPE